MRLELLAPHPLPAPNPGTPAPACGVSADEPFAVRPRRPMGRMGWLLVLAAAYSLLGQGERFRVDPRLSTPSATLQSFWESLRENDAAGAYDCLAEGRHDVPEPGALWFLPPTDELWLTGFRSLPVTAGRVMVSYEVHYRPSATGDERMFRTGSELVRTRGEWRIARPLGQASMPEWKPTPGPVTI